jgi:hypothetical protein
LGEAMIKYRDVADSLAPWVGSASMWFAC